MERGEGGKKKYYYVCPPSMFTEMEKDAWRKVEVEEKNL